MSALAPSTPGFRLASRCAGLQPSAIREILKTTTSPEVISFAGGLPAPELFPVAALGRAAQAVLAEDGPAALQYGLTEGYGPLRQWVAEYLARTAGLRVSPEQVLIVNGSQQGLDLAAKVLLDPGDLVLAENPAYLGALQTFAAYEAQVVGVASDVQGLRPDALRRVLETAPRRPKLLYLIPQFQNPTGTSLAAERRRAVVSLAAEFGVPILEDDPYGRLRYSGEALPALVGSPEVGDWLYLGTASKILAPGLRVAWLVASDRAMAERLVTAKQAADLHTSSFAQRLVWEHVRCPGLLEEHIRGLCSVYGWRRDAMLFALERHFPAEARWTRPEGGLFLWVELPPAIDTTALLAAALRERVAFVPGEPFWIGEPRRHTLRLNFSNASDERIEEGIRRLGAVIRSARAQSSRYQSEG
jgi:2-aminoadipate transaminase